MSNIEEIKKASNNPKTPEEIRWLINSLEKVCKDLQEIVKIINSFGNSNFKYSLEICKTFNNSSYLKLSIVQGGLVKSVQLEDLTSKAASEFLSRVNEIEKKYVGQKEVVEEEKKKEKVEEEEDDEFLIASSYDAQKIVTLLEKNELYDDLNEEQKKAVFCDPKPQCVIAGAGTGKTRILVNRFYYLVAEKNICPSKILIITFTKKSAHEIKERIREKIDLKPSVLKYICTFHSFFLNVLKRDLGKVNEEWGKFRVIEEESRRNLIRKVYLEKNIHDVEDSFFDHINLLLTRYNQENSKEEIEEYAEKLNVEKDVLLEIINGYYDNLENINSLDFDGFERKINELFDLDEKIREKWSKRFDAILIDEFQDTSIKQFEAIKKITTRNTNIFVVGDPDQSIYGFRSAMPKSFNSFMDYFQIDIPIKLGKNFRSSQNILEISNILINKNPRDEKFKNDLWSDNEVGEKVIYEWADNKEKEIDLIVKKVDEIVSQKKVDLNEIAILYRNTPYWKNYKRLIDGLSTRKIPHKTHNPKMGFLCTLEIRFIIAILNVIVLDDCSYCYITDIMKNMDGFSKKFKPMTLPEIWKFCNWALENKYSFSNAMKNISNIPMNPTVAKLLRHLQIKVEGWRAECEEFPLDLWLEGFLNNPSKEIIFMQAVDWRINRNICKMLKILKKRSLKIEKEELVRNMLFVEITTYEEGEDVGVFVDTIHQSKGLEWKYVFLMGVDRNFPSSRGGRKINIEEERRVAYVGFTRAKQKLSLSGCITKPKEESQFIDNDIKNSPAFQINNANIK